MEIVYNCNGNKMVTVKKTSLCYTVLDFRVNANLKICSEGFWGRDSMSCYGLIRHGNLETQKYAAGNIQV